LRQFDDFLPFRSAAIVFAHLLILTPGHCQEVSQNPARGAFEKLLVKDATPIKLKLKRGVYSQYAQVGDVVEYLVDEELVVNGKIIVPEGTIVKGKVVSAEHKRTMGRGGKIDISADSVKLFNSQSIPLRAFQKARGGGQGLDMSGEMLAAASLTLGVGTPFVLLKHGKDIEIRQGSSFTAYVNGDTFLEDIAFPVKGSAPVNPPPGQVPVASKTSESLPKSDQTVAISISSSPAGAEIEFDGNFVGNTPETLKVLPGGSFTFAVPSSTRNHYSKHTRTVLGIGACPFRSITMIARLREDHSERGLCPRLPRP
jgi:PEGA domain